MNQSVSVPSVWTRELISSAALRKALGASLFLLLTALGAFVRIPLPFTPVPVTLQTLFVLLAGLALGGGLGVVSEACYVALGALGLPLFAGAAGGLAVLAGPTGGYLVAFPIAAWVTGRVAGSEKASWPRVLLALIAGTLVIYALGVAQLTVVLQAGLVKGIQLGALPFLPGDAVKIAVALVLYQSYRTRLARRFK